MRKMIASTARVTLISDSLVPPMYASKWVVVSGRQEL